MSKLKKNWKRCGWNWIWFQSTHPQDIHYKIWQSLKSLSKRTVFQINWKRHLNPRFDFKGDIRPLARCLKKGKVDFESWHLLALDKLSWRNSQANICQYLTSLHIFYAQWSSLLGVSPIHLLPTYLNIFIDISGYFTVIFGHFF